MTGGCARSSFSLYLGRTIRQRRTSLAFPQARRRHLHLEGPLLADLLVGLGVGLHRLGLDHDDLGDGQLLKEFFRRGAAFGGRGAPFVVQRLRGALRGLDRRLQLLERERELRSVQLLALARDEEQLAQLLQLPAQGRVLVLQRRSDALQLVALALDGEVGGGQVGERRHGVVDLLRVGSKRIRYCRAFFIAHTTLFSRRLSGRCRRAKA